MKIANEAGFSFRVDAGGIDDSLTSGLKNVKKFQDFIKLGQRKSIMTMASPGFYFYPLIVSAAIDPEYLMSISKGFQLTYASSVATAYSLNREFNRKFFPNASDYVKSFHQNDTKIINANIVGAASSLGLSMDSYIETDDDDDKIAIEATIITNQLTANDILAINLMAWDDTRDSLVMESLNDMVKPYDRTIKILEEKINTINDYKNEKAMEGKFGDFIDQLEGTVLDKDNAHRATGINPRRTITKQEVVRDSQGRPVIDRRTGKPKTKDIKIDQHQPVMPTFKNEVVRNQQLESLEPTMVNVQLVAYGGKNANGSSEQSIHNITLCVKVMPRILGSNLMIASLIEACEESHGIFKFLKWTKGEIKTLDYVLGISASKKRALQKNAKNEVRLLEQSRKRKGINGVGKFLSNQVLPTTSFVITTYEADKVKEACGVDLTNLTQAMRFMNKYYLLAFGIYDTEQNTMKILFDCDSDWGYTTIGSLKSAVSKTNDVLNQNEVLRLFGRR